MVLTVGTDCSGIEAPLVALNLLGINYKQLWRCDIDKFANITGEANFAKPVEVFYDITKRNHNKLPNVDLYVIGFPCQPFSMVGNRQGMNDKRSNVIHHMVKTIAYSKPKIFILENVRGFKTIDNGKPYKNLIEILSKDYNLSVDIYNTCKYGLPQNRERIYFVGIRKDISKKIFIKPKEKVMSSISKILDFKTLGSEPRYSEMKYKINEIKGTYHIVNGSFTKNHVIMINKCPTIVTKAPRHYIWELKRYFTNKELLQLQGFPKSFKQIVSDTQFLKQIGNSMSTCVLTSIIKEALKCI